MADFLTVNLGSILKTQSASSTQDSTKSDSSDDAAKDTKLGQELNGPRNLNRIPDWKKELEKRQTYNRSLPADKRTSEYNVESKFFEDYFYNGNPAWDKSCAKQLISLGEPLKKAMKILGFSRKTNPILCFITDRYVINNLIKTKLLNVNTFKAIFEAVANRLIANSELQIANDYNIIYCKDLYKKPAGEMLDYIKQQAKVLPPRGGEYSAEDMARNIKTFFYLEDIQEQGAKERKEAIDNLANDITLPNAKSSSTRLNQLTFAKLMINGESVNDDTDDDGDTKVSNASDNPDEGSRLTSVDSFITKLVSGSDRKTAKARLFAALQYISMNTGNGYASSALGHDIFKDVAITEIISASKAIAGVMKSNKLANDEVKDFITTAVRYIRQNN